MAYSMCMSAPKTVKELIAERGMVITVLLHRQTCSEISRCRGRMLTSLGTWAVECTCESDCERA